MAQLVTNMDVVPKLSPWPDSVEGLARLAENHRLIGLSNAGRRTLLRINAHACLRTAYVARPAGDPPVATDRFDFYAEDLADLAVQLAKQRM